MLECDWAKNIFQLLGQFDVTDPLRVKAITLMRRDVCKTAVRKIKCCDPSKENIKKTNVEETDIATTRPKQTKARFGEK